MNLNQCLDILELPRDTSSVSYDDAKAAHRLLVQVWHPDRYTHNDKLLTKSTEKMKQVNHAWGELQAQFKRMSSGGRIARHGRTEESRYRQPLSDFEKVVRCPSCMSDNLVRDIRCAGKWCDTCRYELIPRAHKVEIDRDTNLMWPVDANISRKAMSRDESRLWLGKLNYYDCNNWRLPTREDFAVIKRRIDQRKAECYHPDYFQNVQAAPYWVTGDNASEISKWGRFIVKGGGSGVDSVESCFVWPVRTMQR